MRQHPGESNVLVYSLSFSPARAETVRDLKGENPNAGQSDLLAPIIMGVNGLRKNVASTVASLSGGEYGTFANKRTFDDQMDALANHDRNRYLISFQATDPKPGPHAVAVRLRNPKSNVVVTARSMYWAVAKQPTTKSAP